MAISPRTLLAAAAALVATTALPGWAQDRTVVLTASDGSAEITGELVEFADGFYRIRTALGVLRLSAERMICAGAACPALEVEDADVVFAGSASLAQGVLPLLVTGFANAQGAEATVINGATPGQAIATLVSDQGFGDEIGTYRIDAATSDAAFQNLLSLEAQVGMSTRRILPVEARSLRNAGGGNMIDVSQEKIIAVDPVTVIVHPANPISRIRMDDLARVFAGEITDWAELGAPAGPITVYTRQEGATSRAFFDRRVFGTSGRQVSPQATVAVDFNQMAAAITADPGAIGYTGFAFQRGAKPVSLVKTCGITATPSAFSSKTEAYPLDRRLYLYARADTLTPEIENFFDYAISPEADGVIAKAGFVDLGIARISQDNTGGRMRDLIENTTDLYELGLMRELLVEMLQWDRLSTTLRFASGSSRLDERGRIDLERLIEFLAAQPVGTEVAFVGFTDSDGAFEGNRRLAIGRAQQVLTEVAGQGDARLRNIQFSAMGFGELSPSTCNDTPEGKRVNRRVEVWIRGGSDLSTGGIVRN